MNSLPCRLLSLTVTVAICAPNAALSQAGGSWTPNGSMPFERGEIAVVAVNDKIYVISGSSRGVEANAFNQEVDPATGMWRERALMPSVASHAGAAVLNGRIYIVGGFVANVHVGAVSRVFEYDPATDRWRLIAPPPMYFGPHECGTCGKIIYGETCPYCDTGPYCRVGPG